MDESLVALGKRIQNLRRISMPYPGAARFFPGYQNDSYQVVRTIVPIRSKERNYSGFNPFASSSMLGKKGLEMDETLIGLGKRIHELRRKARLTQAELAEKAEVSAKYVGAIEGARANPSFTIVARIARAFGLSVSEMLLDYRNAGLSDNEVKSQIDQMIKEATKEKRRKALKVLRVICE